MKKTLCVILTAVIAMASMGANAFSVGAQANSSSGGIGLSTGINLSIGQVFDVVANPTDLWSAGALPRWSNADGLIANLFATGSDESGQSAGTLIGQNFGLWSQHGLSAPFGALVGEISNQFFLLGTNFTGPAVATGELKLYYWDSNSGDNANSINVTVRVPNQNVPEPGSLMLAGLAMAALAFRKRR